MPKFAVIIPAAGAGKRFGGDVKKPFAQIENRPIFIRTIELFVNRPDVCRIMLAVSPDDYDVVREKYAAQIMFMDIKLVKGGRERYESVNAALQELPDEADFVCVHDAVRPCIFGSWLDRVFEQAASTGGAMLAAPLVGTIKRVEEQRVSATIPREGLWEAQTPQVFRKEWMRKAYAERPADFHPTDDAQLIERLGLPIAVVEADRRNIKITTPGDMTLATTILRDIASQKKRGGPMGAFDEAQW